MYFAVNVTEFNIHRTISMPSFDVLMPVLGHCVQTDL